MNLRRTVFLIFLILAIAGGAWGAYYAREKGFTRTWRELIEAEISKQGYYVDIGKLTLGPLQGLVAQDVRFYQESNRKTVIAFIDKVILDIDLSQVMDKKIRINTIDFKDADLSLPIDPKDKNSERLQIRRCSARILMPADKIEIVKAEALIHGIQFSLKGSLFKAPTTDEQSDSSDQDPEVLKKAMKKKRAEQIQSISARRQLFHQILTQLDTFVFPADQVPRIELDVHGALDELDSLRITARISANNLSRLGYSTKKINALIDYDGSSVKLRQLNLQDDKGNLRLRGEWLRSEKYVDFNLESSIDVQSLAHSIYPSPAIGEVVFFSPPQIDIEGRWFFDRALEFPKLPLTAIGKFHCEKFGSRGEVFDGLKTDFSLADGKYYLRNVRLDHKSGMAIANGLYDIPNQDFRFEAEIKFDITTFIPFMPKEKTRKFLRKWRFDNESTVYLGVTGSGPSWQPRTWNMSGPIDLRNCRFNGVFFEHISLDFEANDKRQHYYRNLVMARPDGVGSADLVSNHLDNKQFKVVKGQWTLPIVTGMSAFSPKLAEKLTPYRFSKPPSIQISGHIDARKKEELGSNIRQNNLDITFTGNTPLSYKFLGKDLKLDQPKGHLTIKEDTIHLTSFTAKTLNGELTAEYRIEKPNTEKKYAASVELNHVDFRELTRLYSNYESTTGDLHVQAELQGIHGDLNTMSGSGSVNLHNGDLFAVPMLGPFSKIMTDIMPKAKPGYSVVKEASAVFTLEDGIVRTENLEALGSTFKFKSDGSIRLSDKKINMDASFDIRGTAGILLSPVSKVVSKIFQYHAEGTMSDPQWEAKYIPRIIPKKMSIFPRRNTAAPAPTETDKPRKKLFNFRLKSSKKKD
ncbi:MAG: AsmA-like C-terminal region-containing protein [Verrucomicrobiota bacterium]